MSAAANEGANEGTSEVASRLRSIEQRIDASCRRAGRPRSQVTLVGASKVQSTDVLRAAFDAGLRTFGENRVQEAAAKAPRLPDGIDWHLIGPLQSNKARPAVELFSTIHSIDRLKIARALDRVAGEEGVVRRGLLEVNVAAEPTKHGFAPAALDRELLENLAELPHLEIVGLMAIPPFETDPEQARRWFRRLRQLAQEVGEIDLLPHWRAELSMGMSGDFEVAVEEGAHYVRVGTALFGPRRPRGAA